MEKININLNQNLWAVLIALIGIGSSEYYDLPTLFCFSKILAIISFTSLLITIIFYTFRYCNNIIKN